MKKYLIILTSIIIIIPSVTFASWWNPATWFSKWAFRQDKSDQIKVLENKIEILEKKLLEQSEHKLEITDKNNSSTTTTTGKVIENISSTTEVSDKINIIKSSVVPTKPLVKKIPTDPNPLPTTAQIKQDRDYESIYKEILGKYMLFNSKIKTGIITYEKINNKSTLQQNWIISLNKILDQTKIDIQELSMMPSPKTSDVDALVVRLSSLEKDYENKSEQYEKSSLIQYLKDNRDNIDSGAIHAEIAKLLYSYDKDHGTDYAKEFRETITKQQSIEFIDKILADFGYF